ncbi:MAG: hypothetical protein J7L22_01510, partial [Candidatus Marinimicrobia bacterium]|nr:hypothetical protein [Candidatus Neomarinimicrobiota bacterium]
MKKIIVAVLFLFCVSLFANAQQSEERTIYLKNGDQITGSVIATDAQSGEIRIKTKYGIITVQQDDILEEVVTIKLISGDRLKGRILSKNQKYTDLLTDYGLLKIDNTDIADIGYGLQDKGKKITGMKEKFALNSERQIDVFYDPTGYTLDKSTLYFSGLSWGFGITDKFQVTSKWAGYFTGDFNLRPKLQLFRFGTFENEHTFSIGGHIHSRYNPDKFEWIEKEYMFENGVYDEWGNWEPSSNNDSTRVYFGGYYKIGTKVDVGEDDMKFNTLYSETDIGTAALNLPNDNPYYEVFAAYTFSRKRANDAGRFSHTFGTVVGKHPEKKELMYKFYYAGGIDMRR